LGNHKNHLIILLICGSDIIDVVPCCVLRFFSREHTGKYCKMAPGERDIHSMIEDLQRDTTSLSGIITYFFNSEKSIDTVFLLYNDLGKVFNSVLFKTLEVTYGYPSFISSDRTIQQLKSSGGMRLIKNEKAVESIIDYDAEVRNFQIDINYFERFFQDVQNQRFDIIDGQDLKNDLKIKSIEEIKKIGKNYLFTNDPQTLGRFRNKIYELQSGYTHSRKLLTPIKEKVAYRQDYTNMKWGYDNLKIKMEELINLIPENYR
jgi:hypothetical protein